MTEQSDEIPVVFVYGTLRRGQERAGVMEAGGQFMGEAETVAGFGLFDLGPFPAMAAINGDPGTVCGELWRVTPGTLEQLDAIEGHPDFYRRSRIAVEGRDGSRRWVWAYLLLRASIGEAERIVGGDWVSHKTERAGTK